jgi:hypothetical protein
MHMQHRSVSEGSNLCLMPNIAIQSAACLASLANAHTPSCRPADTFPPDATHNRFEEYREPFLNLRYRLLKQQL